jgi:hypothetical protein
MRQIVKPRHHANTAGKCRMSRHIRDPLTIQQYGPAIAQTTNVIVTTPSHTVPR